MALTAIAVAAAVENVSLAVTQFHGEDEPQQALAVARIAQALQHFDGLSSIARIGEVLTAADNPPLRYLLSLPGWLIAPHTEWGLRAAAVLASLVVVALVVALGAELGGRLVGYGAGLLVACSGVFAWISLAFGWSVIDIALLAAIRSLRHSSLDLRDGAEMRRVYRLTAWTAVAVLVNVGAILFFAGLALAYVPANRRRPARLVRAFAPGVLFYAGYYIFFAFVSPWALTRYWHGRVPSGQFAHGQGRVAHAALNVDSFLSNLQGLNAYVLPFASWALVILGAVWCARSERRVLAFLAPFALAWSFVLEGDSQSYFLLCSIPLLPYGVAELVRVTRPRIATPLLAIMVGAVLAWSVALFVVRYTDSGYPRGVLAAAYATADRIPNVVEPYGEIAADLDRELRAGDRYAAVGAGAFPLFYAKRSGPLPTDPRALGVPTELVSGRCARFTAPRPRDVRAVVSDVPLCPSVAARVRRYRGSRLALYVLLARPG